MKDWIKILLNLLLFFACDFTETPFLLLNMIVASISCVLLVIKGFYLTKETASFVLNAERKKEQEELISKIKKQ